MKRRRTSARVQSAQCCFSASTRNPSSSWFAATVCVWLSSRRTIRCSAKRWKPCRACAGSCIWFMPRCAIWLPVSRRPRFSPTLSTSVRTITASGARASVTRQTKFSHTSLLSCPPTPNSIASSLFLLIEEVFS